MTLIAKAIACLLPNLAIAMGSIVLTVSEASGKNIFLLNLDNVTILFILNFPFKLACEN